VHLRFDINASTLPEEIRERLLKLGDQRISKDGVVIIKAQEFRSLEGNRVEALRRLHAMIDRIAVLPRRGRPTKPIRGSVTRRLGSKTRRASVKTAAARSTREFPPIEIWSGGIAVSPLVGEVLGTRLRSFRKLLHKPRINKTPRF
jgi:ribosome-associated protein